MIQKKKIVEKGEIYKSELLSADHVDDKLKNSDYGF
jgi:hypothetical protein